MSELAAGSPPQISRMRNPYLGNSYAISEGQKAYQRFNCSGCHSNGGGGMGPALMDRYWIYGDSPENIFATIVQGRPNGMPSFGGKIPPDQIWQIVAYVRSLGGLQPRSATPARTDHLYPKPSEGPQQATGEAKP